jgi:hypothetical protein
MQPLRLLRVELGEGFMTRMLLAPVLLTLALAPFGAAAQTSVTTRTVIVGNAAVVDVKPNAIPGAASSAASAARSREDWLAVVHGDIPMTQVLVLPPATHRDR